MPALTTRKEARERLLKLFEQSLARIIPAEDVTPLLLRHRQSQGHPGLEHGLRHRPGVHRTGVQRHAVAELLDAARPDPVARRAGRDRCVREADSRRIAAACDAGVKFQNMTSVDDVVLREELRVAGLGNSGAQTNVMAEPLEFVIE